MIRMITAVVLAVAPGLVMASGGGNLQTSHANINDQASLQRGAALFMSYCSGCHSLQYQRYSRMATDLGLTEEQVMTWLNFGKAKFGEQIHSAMTVKNGMAFFGKAPPDLSLIARAKPGGPDWTFTFLKSFYADETRPSGWNNLLLPGASMPNVLWELQGTQRAVTEHKHKGADGQDEACHTAEVGGACFKEFAVSRPGLQGATAYDQTVRDITAFLAYVGEPAALQRTSIGVWVILFLAVFTFLAWLLKHEYWRDVH